jgi:hypothetical protein
VGLAVSRLVNVLKDILKLFVFSLNICVTLLIEYKIVYVFLSFFVFMGSIAVLNNCMGFIFGSLLISSEYHWSK